MSDRASVFTPAAGLAPCSAPVPPPAAASVPHPRPFACRLRVADDEVSRAVAHVSNVHYVAWLDRAAELHGDAVGYTRERMLEDDLMWFVARHEIDYVAEAVPGDELLLLTWVRDMRRIKSWRDTVVYRPTDGQIVCRAATLWVLVALADRRPARVPEAMARAFDPLEPPRLAPA